VNLFQHLVSFAATMLSVQDPYRDEYEHPRIVSTRRDECGDVVEQTVRASNHHDATRHMKHTTIAGNRSVTATRTGAKTWKVKAEDWSTNTDPRYMSDDEYDAYLAEWRKSRR
jgi:hypothetical protein